MDIATLIQLLADIKPKCQVYFENSQRQVFGISSISSDKTNENHSVFLKTNSAVTKPLHVWELVILLKQQDPTALVIVTHQKSRQQIFGVRFADGQVYLK
ncbi:hypothetical protein [Bombilactobacillus bombi]|uniref:hypothetical protein n=1 Tax=Bombilactobacillus bombi TaxID=1303590 RepID=UPI0015E5F748|nr:hypothetical protein [Bombilactobacillus bombi]MBA1434784.1 hypothetical protein [Bombilactobacillus bombi]